MPSYCKCGCRVRVSNSGMYAAHCAKIAAANGESMVTHKAGKKRNLDVQLEIAAKKIALRLCVRCRDPLPEDHPDASTSCNSCRKWFAGYLAEWSGARLAEGLCHRCGKAPHRPNTQICLDCTEVQRQYDIARAGSEERAHMAEKTALENRELVVPTLPYCEQYDLKADYIRKHLKKLPIPDNVVYCDSESLMGQDGNAAHRVYEWTFYKPSASGSDSGEWLELRQAAAIVREKRLKEWAVEVVKFIGDTEYFMCYGHSKCDWNRLESLFAYLPIDIEEPVLKCIEPQRDVFSKITSKDERDEFKVDAPVYMPYAGLTSISKYMWKIADFEYPASYQPEAVWDGKKKVPKSYVDVCYLYEAFRAIKKIINKEKLGIQVSQQGVVASTSQLAVSSTSSVVVASVSQVVASSSSNN